MRKKIAKADTGCFSTPFTASNIKHLINEKERVKKSQKKAYLTAFKDHPELAVVVFSENRAAARWTGCKYFKEECHPDFLKRNDYQWELYHTVTKRTPEFDKYLKEEKVPVAELMRVLNASFNCSVCGKHSFKFEDYVNGRCFILEGEGDLNNFTKGLVLCYSCYRKIIGGQ